MKRNVTLKGHKVWLGKNFPSLSARKATFCSFENEEGRASYEPRGPAQLPEWRPTAISTPSPTYLELELEIELVCRHSTTRDGVRSDAVLAHPIV